MKKYTSSDIKKLPAGRHAFGQGLYLNVTANGTRQWLARVTVDGKRTWRGLGDATLVKLTEARVAVINTKVNPAPRKINPAEFPHEEELRCDVCFGMFCDHLAARQHWKKPEYEKKFRARMERYFIPSLGFTLVDDVTPSRIADCLKPIWTMHNPTAQKVLSGIKMMFDYAIAIFECGVPNPASWEKVGPFLPDPHRVHKTKHHRTVSWRELPDYVPALLRINTPASRAILFGMLTACRKMEYCVMKWDEINFEEKVWYLPAERRKDGLDYPHRVPLSTRALEILSQCPRTSPYVFTYDGSAGLSKCTINYLIDRRKLPFTPHGMRSTFRDWAAENEKDFIASEKALCHSVGSAITQAYLRTDMLEKRRPLMEEWAAWCFSKV